MTDPRDPIIHLGGVCKAFAKPSGEPLAVLSGVDLALREGEVLGLLGRSGSGKSTILRIAAGLLRPTTGVVRYRGEPLTGPAEGIAVVFQTFALFPWLTVLENVELGLEALGLPRDEARGRTLAAIDLIGLDGFQSAYPRELSGGMRQRVGFARALLTQPIALLMDEPFSALDVLTAETLRTDLLDLWVEHRLPTKAILLVTHNIEEAVLLCDRILVLQPNPGRIAAEIAVPLKHPRNRADEAFQEIVDDIYATLTAHTVQSAHGQVQGRPGLSQPLPPVAVDRLAGLIEAVAAPPYGGHADLADVAQALNQEIDDLFPLADALQILGFAQLDEGRIRLTTAGKMLAESGTDDRKRLFAEHLLQFVPLAAHIRHVLEEREGHQAPRVRFEYELEDHLTRNDAERTLRAVIGWGRYAEVFEYDAKTRTFYRRSERP
jgi:NitT/TauT family transport system ATP-binding protein